MPAPSVSRICPRTRPAGITARSRSTIRPSFASRRLEKLLSGGREARRLRDEAARYNIGEIERNVNVPTLALSYLETEALYRSNWEVGDIEENEHAEVVEGFWELQDNHGLYGLNENAIRVTEDGMLYHVFNLPAEAPEGKYRILTHFLRDDTLVAVTRNDLFVRQSGLIAWLSRLAERHAMTYGGFTVAIALLAGFLAGSLFKGGAKH